QPSYFMGGFSPMPTARTLLFISRRLAGPASANLLPHNGRGQQGADFHAQRRGQRQECCDSGRLPQPPFQLRHFDQVMPGRLGQLGLRHPWWPPATPGTVRPNALRECSRPVFSVAKGRWNADNILLRKREEEQRVAIPTE